MAQSIEGGVVIVNTLSTKNNGNYPLVMAESVNLKDGTSVEDKIKNIVDNSYVLPQATESELGGIKAKTKTTENVEVAIDTATGKLYVPMYEPAARNFSVAGDATAPAVSFDGSNDVTLNVTLNNVVTGGTATKVTFNDKGLVTGSANLEVADLPDGIGVNKLTGVIPSTEKGVANGVATLDEAGKVPAAQLPSYVDDVIEGYLKNADGKFYKTKVDSTYSEEIVGEDGKIYVDVDTNKTYRWSGSIFVEISSSLALGETSSTAFAGDKGKVAYDHAQITQGNPHGTTAADVGAAEAGHISVIATDSQLGHVKLGAGFTAPEGVLTLVEIDGGTF